jgi:hypothetical protein
MSRFPSLKAAIVMGTKFAGIMRGLEEEARTEGPKAVAQLEAFRDHYRAGRRLAQARLVRSNPRRRSLGPRR